MKRLRPFIALGVILATVAAFVYYFAKHPEVGHQLRHTSLGLLIWLLFLYLLSIMALAGTTVATLRLCKLQVGKGESFLLTAYSAVINFFGPLQSGPAFRATYLKKKYDLNLKKFTAASLVYLFFWGVYSGLMLLYGLLHWWLLTLLLLAIVAALMLQRLPIVQQRLKGLDLKWWYFLALATLIQIGFVAIIYYSELRSVAPGTSFSQAVIYTGAANLALYVSLTPGAIGFRESFLVFSSHLHHVSNSSIVAASILDRAVYIVLLLILAVFIFGTHLNQRLQTTKNR
ncbi:MAG TPA: lysylphosphatidylglycerol synthase domain-containing protein [Candidatus Saccharimonadales bacterium]|jgi:uncharacterized membrane protein YbhN (UPF0104 family)|nr:lysylphosphatidylglycerol synthase domain-containing protein [Candidatus Saccharimonadales bacterium]